MKNIKVAMLIILSFAFVNVKAEEFLSVDIEENKGETNLVLGLDGESISYDKAVKKGLIEKYISIDKDGKTLYFYLGKEISEKEYLVGSANEDADLLIEEYGEYGIRVDSLKSIEKNIEDIFDNLKIGKFHLVFAATEKDMIDFDELQTWYTNKYGDKSINHMYKYDDYYLATNRNDILSITGEEVIVDTNVFKMTKNEIDYLNEFVDYFVKQFEDQTNYEKILGVYTYLSHTLSYDADKVYDSFLEANISAYDAFFKKTSVCIGAATSFQLMMEKMGIDSYIIDVVLEDGKSTSHTYNIVNLDDEWYIVDIHNNDDLSGLLINDKDFKGNYQDIKISKQTYLENHPDLSTKYEFDYETINTKIEELLNSQDKKEILETKKEEISDDSDLVYVILILVFILIVIYLFTKKDKK